MGRTPLPPRPGATDEQPTGGGSSGCYRKAGSVLRPVRRHPESKVETFPAREGELPRPGTPRAPLERKTLLGRCHCGRTGCRCIARVTEQDEAPEDGKGHRGREHRFSNIEGAHRLSTYPTPAGSNGIGALRGAPRPWASRRTRVCPVTDLGIAGVVVAGISGIAGLMWFGVRRAGRRLAERRESDRGGPPGK